MFLLMRFIPANLSHLILHQKLLSDKKHNQNMSKKVVFLCGARDYHAIDWYRSSLELMPNKDICILTDLIDGEGVKKLINSTDQVYKLIIIDKFLFKRQSKIGNIWRNIVKLLVFPIQIILLKRFSKRNPNAIYHAHSMYYLFLGWAAKIDFIGTPQGSDVLVKPFKSKAYKYFAIKSLKAAKAVTVDSENMKNRVMELAQVDSHIIQNGIDIHSIIDFLMNKSVKDDVRDKMVSMRGITPLYRIRELIQNRNSNEKNESFPLTFIYPFVDNQYKNEVFKDVKSYDTDLGRVDRFKMYVLFTQSKIAFSIPVSDSSPRSVYEAIFCGSAVAIAYNPYYEILPQCMKSRIIIIDLDDPNWFKKSISEAKKIEKTPFMPSEEALDLFDQRKSLQKMADLFFN